MAMSEQVEDDDPVRLQDAAVLFFPAGQMTLSALRTEARKERLATFTIAGKQYTTRRAVREMIERCRDQGSRPASSSEKTETSESGSSGTDEYMSAQDALRIRLTPPSERCKLTLRKGTAPTHRNVVPLRSS